MAMRSPSRFTNSAETAPLVGREPAQAALRQRLEGAGAGQGSFVLVGGAAGIGKTTLVQWLAAEAGALGADVLIGHAYDLTLTPPYGPWIDALAGASRLPHPLVAIPDVSAITSQPLLFEQFRLFLERLADERPVVLALEDLHWSDPASLELMRFVARGVDRSRLLLIATYRSDELTRDRPLFGLLPQLVREAAAERIDLQTLTDDETRTFVASRYHLAPADADRLATWLQARGQGNPLYLSEMLRTLEAERVLRPAGELWKLGALDRSTVPPLVKQIIEGRLATLDDDTRTLLETAAVIGQEIALDIWQVAGEASMEQIALASEHAGAARLIAETTNVASVAFTHALIRETLYEGISLARRRLIHQRVAEALARRADPPVNAVASHFGQADDPQAIDWFIRAGERALTLYAAQDAIAALNRAHDLAGRFDRSLPAEAYRTRAGAHAMVGEFDSARRDYELVLDRGRASADGRVEWQALVDLSLLWSERDYERTGGYCRAALKLARSIGEPSMIAHSLNRVANWHVNLDEPDTALPLHREALAIFEASGDREGIADSLDLLGMASYLSCDLVASTDYYERAIPIFRYLDKRHQLAGCLAAIVFNGGETDSDIAMPVYREQAYWNRSGEEGLAIAREIDWPSGEALALFALSMLAGARGDYQRALRDAEESLRVAERVDHRQWAIAARFTLGAIWMEMLDLPRAQRELEQALADARRSGSRFWTNIVAGSLASAQLIAGEIGQASALLETIAQPAKPRQSMGQLHCEFVRAKLALASEEPDRALAILDQLREMTPNSPSGHGTAPVLKTYGDAFAQLGRLNEAEEAYLAARDLAALFEFRPLIWRTDAAIGELLRATGRLSAANVALDRARATIEDMAFGIEDAEIREPFRTRALGRLPAPATTDARQASATTLSPRELDVLRLLVEGMSDREIGSALYISPRTVMRHVTGILTKLDVPTRTAAAALAIRQGIV